MGPQRLRALPILLLIIELASADTLLHGQLELSFPEGQAGCPLDYRDYGQLFREQERLSADSLLHNPPLPGGQALGAAPLGRAGRTLHPQLELLDPGSARRCLLVANEQLSDTSSRSLSTQRRSREWGIGLRGGGLAIGLQQDRGSTDSSEVYRFNGRLDLDDFTLHGLWEQEAIDPETRADIWAVGGEFRHSRHTLLGWYGRHQLEEQPASGRDIFSLGYQYDANEWTRVYALFAASRTGEQESLYDLGSEIDLTLPNESYLGFGLEHEF